LLRYIKIVLSGIVSIGRLTNRIETEGLPSSRWLVTFDHQNIKDQEVCEKSFGKLIDDPSTVQYPQKKENTKSSKKGNPSLASTITSSADEKTNQSSQEAKKINLPVDSSPTTIDNGKNPAKTTKKAKNRNFKTRSTSQTKKISARVNKRKKKGKKPKEECTRVPFLTGTLLLYRGENPRAVFVRKF